MSKCTHKKETVTLSVASNQVVGTLDVTNCNGASVQLNGLAGSAGSMKLQQSNDNTNWADIASATATISGVGPYIINVSALYTGHIRALVTLSGGAGSYTAYFLGKER